MFLFATPKQNTSPPSPPPPPPTQQSMLQFVWLTIKWAPLGGQIHQLSFYHCLYKLQASASRKTFLFVFSSFFSLFFLFFSLFFFRTKSLSDALGYTELTDLTAVQDKVHEISVYIYICVCVCVCVCKIYINIYPVQHKHTQTSKER